MSFFFYIFQCITEPFYLPIMYALRVSYFYETALPHAANEKQGKIAAKKLLLLFLIYPVLDIFRNGKQLHPIYYWLEFVVVRNILIISIFLK